MNTITVTEFEALVERKDWQREQQCEVVERTTRQKEEWSDAEEDIVQVDIPHVWGVAWKVSSLDGVTITFNEGFNYDDFEPDSLCTGVEGMDDVWTVEGVTVVDEDGDELTASDLCAYLGSDFSDIDYSVLEIEQEDSVDVCEDSDLETFTIEVNNAPDIRFTGERLAHVASSDDVQGVGGSVQAGRWMEHSLYRTVGGKYVCHSVERTRWRGEEDCFRGKVCETLDEVKEFFGKDWLAEELYAEAAI